VKYLIEWIKSIQIGFDIYIWGIELRILWFAFWINRNGFHISICLPKYSPVLTMSDKFIYDDFTNDNMFQTNYWFYRKVIYKNVRFFIMHTLGENAIEVIREEN
jgi:hypothetical protein